MKIKYIQEELFAGKCVGSFINWEKPFEDVNEGIFDPSVEWMSFDYHSGNLALKSPAITAKDGLLLFISVKNVSNSQ